jgi:hypothetical protein
MQETIDISSDRRAKMKCVSGEDRRRGRIVGGFWHHPVMAATADDYAWFEECFPDLAEGYCLTLVRGLSPPQVLARLGARTDGPLVTGVDGLGALGLSTADEQLIAVTEAGGDWALAVEANGHLGVTEDAIVPLSAGTRLVSHFCNVNAVDRLCCV